MKRILVFVLVGGLLGIASASWLGPKWLSYWFRPPVQNNLLSCTESVDWAMSSLVKVQLGGAIGGAVVLAIIGGLATRAWRRRAEQKAAASGTPGPTAAKPQA